MGSKLVSDSLTPGGSGSTVSAPPTLHTKLFYDHFPFYLSIGMTYDQYWNDDPSLVKYYRKAYELQRERRNQELWLQGMYVYEAIGDMSPILRAFSKAKKPVEYPKEPYAITQHEVERRREERKKLAYDRVKSKMSSFAIGFNAKFQRKEE